MCIFEGNTFFCILRTFTAWLKDSQLLCCVATPQGAPADESDGLSASSGRQREAGARHAQLLRAVQEDLHR